MFRLRFDYLQDSLKLIQPLGKFIYANRWKIRKNMLSSLSFVTSGN